MPHRIICLGEMAELTRRFDWARTSLGPIESWSDELIGTLNLMLASRYPMLLWWGAEHIQFYNDACRPSIGEDRHPSALGQEGGECWQETWFEIGPEVETVMESGGSTWNVNRLIPMVRDGRMKEVFWTYSFSPVRNREGSVEGVLVVCNETTEHVISERRLRTLLRIDEGATGTRSVDELASQLVLALGENQADIPFAVMCRVENLDVRVVGESGLRRGVQEIADRLPIREVASSKKPRHVDDLMERAGEFVCEPWPESIRSAYIQFAGSAFRSRYVLVLGISPRLCLDSNYVNFMQLACNRLCQMLESEASQQERRMVDAQRAKLFEAMDEQRELLANIVENAPAGIALLGGDQRVKWCNPYFSAFLGLEWLPEKLIGRALKEVVPNSTEAMEILSRVRDTHEPFISAEYEHVELNRGTTYWRWSLSRLATGDILSVSSEITEQVAARRKLEAFSERLHRAQMAARLGTYDWHLASGAVEWSDEFSEAVGFHPGVKADWEFYLTQVHLQDRERVRRELMSVADSKIANPAGTLQVQDHRLMGRDGQERWVALTGSVHLEPSGKPSRIVGTVSDITSRKRIERDLEQSKKEAQQQWAELEAIYRTAPIGLALFDPKEFRYLRLNSRQAQIVGLPPEEILGKTLTEIAPIEGLREMFEQVARGTPVINALLEGELPMNPGEHRYWTVNYFPVYDASGSIQAISAASLEITAQKRAELALIQSEKIAAVGRLASSISHEINNPLEAVTNLLFLLRSENMSPTGVEYLGIAEHELARVSQIVTHTLRFHRQSTRASVTRAADMIDAIVALHQGRLASAGITVEKTYKTETGVLCFDGEIRQVLNNLIGNSIDAMWRGGRLILRSQIATEWKHGRRGLRITVADTGHGMNDVTKNRLFEAFFTTKGIKGTGLGLWISSEIVRKHDGRLRFRSCREEGRSGTVFQLFLPLEPVSLMKQEAARTQ